MVTGDELNHRFAPIFRQRGDPFRATGLAVAQDVDVGRQAFAFVTCADQK